MKILKSGKLINKANGREEKYCVSKLDLRHIDKLMALQKTVMESMDRKDFYAGLTEEELRYMLSDKGGVMVGVFAGEALVGFYGVYFPGDRSDNLGKDLGISQEQMMYVLHLEGAGVHPHYRGNSLQKVLNGICLGEAMKLRPVKYLCATVSPYNYPSIDHLFAAKLLIRGLKTKYGGMLRYICIRDLEDKKTIMDDSMIDVQSTDHALQSKLLDNGFVGFRLVRSGEICLIGFGRQKCSKNKK